ncbi:MAG: hypothetical protein HY710_02235 [Candidatus Latescibacteria bacterium]|nr:hypothetical protein [Candidatus Latescibacterota bacterium]
MSLWQTVKQELDGPMEKVRKGLTDALDVAEDLTRKGRLKLEIQGYRGEIRTQMTELGGRVYQLGVEESVPDVLSDDTVRSLFARIKDLEQKITEKEQELQRLREEGRAAGSRR